MSDYAWTEFPERMFPATMFSRGHDPTLPQQNNGQPAWQPFTKPENVSAPAGLNSSHFTNAHMARQRRPSSLQQAAPEQQGLAATHDPHGTCFLSAPCDRPDCDEATICYDHALPHVDYHCTDAFNCDQALNCDEACNVDWLCTNESCYEADCHRDHAQLCTDACASFTCPDPTCSDDHLYCCLSDICPHPHKPGVECAPQCRDVCLHSSTLCHGAPAVPCVESHGHSHVHPHPKAPSTMTASQDAMSCSSISTPTTDSLSTPDNLQSLIEAAQILPAPGIPMPQSAQPPRKRMRLEESAPLIHDFNAPFYTANDYWSLDLQPHFPSASIQQPSASTTPTAKSASRENKASREHDDIPICRWHDEITGPCNRIFATIEDLHNHVKEHTGQLVPSKTPNRNFVCRWAGCDKSAPFGTKNHLDRHMQNHTRFKPFACNVCGHRCVTQQQLNNHLTTHSREKKFKCDYPGCGKVFGVKTALSTHKRTHTNEKPFSCKWCGDSYSDSSNLSKHRKTVHEDDKTAIPCPHEGCEYKDSRAQRLERHCRDEGHGMALLSDAHRWSEYTRKKQVRSRTASVAPSVC